MSKTATAAIGLMSATVANLSMLDPVDARHARDFRESEERPSASERTASDVVGGSEAAPNPEAIDAFIARHPEILEQRAILDLDQIIFNRPKDSAQLRRLIDDHSLIAVGKSLDSLGIPFQRGKGRLDLGTLPADIVDRILSLPAGEPFVAPSDDLIVINVITGEERAVPSGDEVRRIATERMRLERVLQNQAARN